MNDRYGYITGISLACATVALALYAGSYTTPRPCIANLSTNAYPFFAWEQQMLDNIVEYSEESDMHREGIKTSAELAHRLVEMSQDSEWPSSIYVNAKTGKEYYVPGLCYVGKVDWLGEPILYRR